MFKLSGWRLSLLFTVALAISAATLHAETGNNRTLSPYFFIDNGDPAVDRFPLKQTNVEVSISGVIADVLVKQTYANDGIRPISARYIFQASTRAAVHGMKMTIGNQVITAKIKEREAAQKQFDQAKKEGKSASLLKQQRPNVFSMNVANVMPGRYHRHRAPLYRIAGADRRHLRIRLPDRGRPALLESTGRKCAGE